MSTSEDFLAHYGKKGMKWGVTSSKAGTQVSGKDYRKVVKETKKENRKELRSSLKARSGKEKVKAFSLDLASFGGYSTAKMARSEGYSKGKSAALGMLGPYGMMTVANIKLKDDVRRKIES